ncbi:DegV family protein [Thermomicrobium sp. 4228-Ro]|uniref:DegV family protein n=1 Tax=Thermomicrobium sp. 4228-Ro TaxID=2993937 RepID=UPI00224906E9|nr:DegV family protein [Thermomicrobium sp. 4228-Ro]MCX2728420.1 DegV family protein [Thermomicrobium sp. 4228-Ro]
MLGIVTDSIACLPGELVERYGIRVVPVRIVRGDRIYRDGIDVTPEEAFAWLDTGEIVTTSQPAVGEFLEVYRDLAARVDGIVSIHVSSGVTGVYQAASAAASMVSGVPIVVIDSRVATMAEGFLVLEAARLAEQGSDLAAVVQRVEALRPRLRFFAVLETVTYLVRSGRAPWLAQLAVDVLQFKPILTLQDGKIVSLERVRTRPRAIEAMLRRMERDVDDRPVHVAVLEAGARTEAEYLAQEVASRFRVVEQYIAPFTAAMALNTGPGLLGLAYYAE